MIKQKGGGVNAATIVSAPKQRNSREENETIKEGKTPEDWKQKPAKNRQKDKDTRWTKKHERSYFGYKNRIGVDRRHKLVRRYGVSGASVHDSQKFEGVLYTGNTASDVWADSAYRSDEIEEKLAERGLKSRIHNRAYRNRERSRGAKVRQRDALEGARPRRACVGRSKERHGGRDRPHHSHCSRAMQDRNAEPRLQHPPLRLSRKDGVCDRVNRRVIHFGSMNEEVAQRRCPKHRRRLQTASMKGRALNDLPHPNLERRSPDIFRGTQLLDLGMARFSRSTARRHYRDLQNHDTEACSIAPSFCCWRVELHQLPAPWYTGLIDARLAKVWVVSPASDSPSGGWKIGQ